MTFQDPDTMPVSAKKPKVKSRAPRERTVLAQVQSQNLVTDRREKIINAAIIVFHSKGYHETTTADIARQAGLTQSNLYNYIKSKQDVLFLVCEHLVASYDNALDEVALKFEDPFDRLEQSIRKIIDIMNDYKAEVQLLYNETHALSKGDRVIILQKISKFIDRFEDLIENFETSTGHPTNPDRRLAANIASFLPAIVALRAWDLNRNRAFSSQRNLLDVILAALHISRPEQAARPA
jgi:AcrR family transcriptional regulator